MTTSGKRFIQNQTKRPVLELSTGTDKEPKPIEITAAEAQTISDATTKPQIQSSAIRQQTEPATISPAERYQTSQTNRELETYQEDMQTLRNENALSSAGRTIGDLQLSAQVAFDTMGTSNLETERERAKQQFEKTRVKTLSYAKPILEKDEETQGLIESAKTGKTNMFETARKDAAEFGAGSAINTTFPNQWVSDNGDTVYFMNSKSTVTKPTLKNTLKFENSRIQDAYNGITYNFAQNGQMYTVQEIKDYYTEWQNVPDDVVQQFIYDACHDVQTGERRNIDLYAEYYPALSNGDKYVNQKDSLLQLLTDDNFIEYGLSEYLAGKTATGEDIDPTKSLQGTLGGEDITKILQAALTLTEAADELNEIGANITQATDYAIAKTYADQFPTIKEALDTFDRINISNEDFQKLVDNYNSNMGNIRQQFRYYGGDKGLSLTEYRKKVDDLVQENMREFNEEFINSWNKERIQGNLDYAESNIISDFFMGNAYKANDGKWYDRNGNEVERNDVNIGLANKYLETFRSFTKHATELEYDTAFAVQDPSRESVINILSDSVGMAFDVFMMGKGGIELQTKFEIPYIGSLYQLGMDATMDQAGEMVLNLANLTLFYDGERTSESQEKFKEAAGGLIFMLGMKEVAKTKGLVRESIKNDIYRSALRKSIKSYTDTLAKGLREIDVEGDQAKILQQQQPEPKPGENAKAEKQIESERTNQKIMFIRNILEKAKKEFNKTFQDELSKEKGDRSIVDTLWNAAINLRQSEKATADTESRITREQERKSELEQRERDIDNEIINAKGEGNADLVEQLRKQKQEIRDQITDIDGKIERLTEGRTTLKDKADEIVESVREAYGETVEGFREWGEEITTPEVRVEEATTEAPKTVEGTAKVKEPQGAKETKTTIAKILDVIQSIQDNAKEIVNNIFKQDIEKQTRKEIEEREARDELFRREGLTEKQIEVVENNPFTDSVIRIVNRLVSEITDKKGNVKDTRLEDKMSNDEIQREVLSDGLTRMQKYVDRIQQLKKAIGKLYDALSTQKNIRSRQFLYSEPFQRLLRENGLEYVERLDDKGNPKRAVVANDGRVLSANERAVAKYIESMIDIITEKSWISEKDAHNIRTNFTSKGDWDSSGNFPKAIKKALYERWNEFLEQQGSSEMLRKIDQGYAELSENLEVLSDLLGKDSTLKDNAKNQILKRDEETLDQMESILPGIKKLVELTRQSPDIVNKTIKAKTQYKQTRVWLGNWIRYAGVMLASTVGGRGGFVLGSLGFTTLERLGNALKTKAVKTRLDRDLYSQYVEALKVDGNTKASFKKGEIERYNELSKIAEGKTQAEIDKLLDDATQILIDRQAARIREQKQAEWERYLRSKGVGDTTPRLPESTQGGVVATDTFTLPKDRGVKETYKDKEKTQQGYNQAEQQIIDASLGKTEETTYSPEAEKVANILDKSLNETANIIEEDATNKVIEKGEEVTDENIAKEAQKEQSSIESFIKEVEKGAPEETKNYDGADIKDLEEVVANPKKYPNVDIEAAKSALEKARRQNQQAEIMQSPDQQQAQKEIAGIYKGNQMEREGNKEREKQREDMVRETNRDFDTLETTEEYDRIESQITPEKGEQAKKYAKGYKGFYRSDKAKTDTLRADMGKKPSQNITYTSSADKIATLENPKSRARVAQERLNKRKRLSEEEKTQLNQIIEKANTEIQTNEERKAKKTELANEYKRLDKKRSETPYRETKKEITKQMDKISDEFDKLTEKEFADTYSKPKEVEEDEAKEQGEMQEFDKAMDENETPQKAEPEIKKQETKKESEGERSFGDEEYTKRDNKIEEMSKDESIAIKDTVNEVEEIVGGGIKDYQEKIYGERRDKEESYTNDGAESFRNEVNNKIRERDNKFWEDQRSKTKDMESSKLTKEQEKQLEEAKTKEEKDALMNKWRKEYIERNPIAEKYLKEAEEHYKQYEKAMNALDKLTAITRRIRRKNAEKIDRAYEERKKKRAEEEKKEIDLLDQNETPQIVEWQEAENETPKPKSMRSLKNMKPENLLKEPDSQEKFLAMEYQMLKLGNQYLSRMKEFKDKYDELFKKYRGENNEKPQVVSSEKVEEGEKETKTDKLSMEERKQLNQINKEIEDSLFYKGGTDARGSMTDREKIEFTNTLSPYKEFYHASDSNIKEFDLDKTKDDPNGIGLSVSTKSDNAYTDKKHQYTIDGKGLLIAKEGTTISEEKIKQISEKLGIEPNEMWQYVPLAELSSFIKGESGKSNKEVIETMRDVTKYDGVETSHDYVLLWNMDKVNPRTKKNKEGDKPEEPTTPKKPEPNKPTGGKSLVEFNEDYTVRRTIGNRTLEPKEIQARMDYLKDEARQKGKWYAKQRAEYYYLKDLLERTTKGEQELEGRWKRQFEDDENFNTQQTNTAAYFDTGGQKGNE